MSLQPSVLHPSGRDSNPYIYSEVASNNTSARALWRKQIDTYSTIPTIIAHEEINSGRKRDLEHASSRNTIRNRLLGERDNQDTNDSSANDTQKGIVTASKLNIRTSPSASASKAASPLELGTIVKIEDEQGDWYKVKVEVEGWVSKDYVN
ncbi:MAG: SH3 domain-containing protein [Bacteroidota bacterium]